MFTFFYNVFLSILILKTGDIKLNPGPNKNSHSYLSCSHWNVNSLASYNYYKSVALNAYDCIYKYDFICIGETFLVDATHILPQSLSCIGLIFTDQLNYVMAYL